ncbi:ATP-dependent DNA helicase [Arachidicoccus ginsenosidimutans]|uniref:ATP-dependent helicase n=1 Tax=Arachidicoccus sp. BS20 TaxID=1850526 RepID=UPI0007F0C692|nr:UvrD-helicase domain-containing protein [Arachidicoccus sp. BS20]ANI89235.1 ATP-dependent DNA helicase [Arachidicoccus sp. BS20]
MQDYLKGLNEQQYEAATHINGPLMIVAGAGSGKTKVLTTRIAHLMAQGVDAFNILALTFTNKAAAEMKERIEKMLGNHEARNLYIGTFHSVFARILRGEAHRLGYPNSFTIYDGDDSKSVLKTVIKEMELDEKHYKPNIVASRISQAKNSLIGPLQYAEDYYIQQEDMRANRPAIAKIYEAYAKRCFKNGAMDFDDLLLKMYELLNTFPEVLHKFQHKFKYVLIDEYQDTNPVQYQITKLLAAAHENICVVGDDAQSIYSFRGATIENILQFQKDYDDVKVVKLEQNYRSTKSILNVANAVIQNNKGQIPKALWTDNSDGEKIYLVRTMTDNDEGKFVASTIQEQKLRNHYNNSDFSILYRTNAQSRSYEENLRRAGIPYKIYGGLSFYQRKEIKDFIAYLRVIGNTRDEEALKRIINYPVRGIGKTTMEKLQTIANESNITLWETLERAGEFGAKGGGLESIKNFVTMIRYFQSLLKEKNAFEVATEMGKHTGLIKELFSDKTTEGLARYENVQELLNSIREWVDTQDSLSQIDEDGILIDNVSTEDTKNAQSLGVYLQQITLLTDADKDDGTGDVVKLMTIHAAKGLEFPVVFVGGLEETLFPSGMSINTREELEEERRLFYVAVTRAKSKLWLTYANTRYRFGNLVQNDPSRFIDEMPKELVDRKNAGGSAYTSSGLNNGNAFGFRNNSATEAERRYGPPPVPKTKTTSSLPSQPPVAPRVIEHKPQGEFVPSDTSDLAEGDKVEHQKFGFGIVVKMEGAAHNRIATVNFNLNGEKKIMLNYAKLKIIR